MKQTKMKESIKKAVAFMLSFALCMQNINIPVYTLAAEEASDESNVEEVAADNNETSVDNIETSPDNNEASVDNIETSSNNNETSADNSETSPDNNEASVDNIETSSDNNETSADNIETSSGNNETSTDGNETAADSSGTVTDDGETAADSSETATDDSDIAVNYSNTESSLITIEENGEKRIYVNSSEAFIELSKLAASEYQNAKIVITQGDSVSFDLTKPSETDGTYFSGLGSEDDPFKGTVEVTNGENNNIIIPVGRPFFNYLDQSATIRTGLYLEAGSNMTEPLLAAMVTNRDKKEDALDVNLRIGAAYHNEDGSEIPYSFGGIIGEITSGSSVKISVNNYGASVLSNSGHLGMFCNKMDEGASLILAGYYEDSAASVSEGTLNYSLTPSDVTDGALNYSLIPSDVSGDALNYSLNTSGVSGGALNYSLTASGGQADVLNYSLTTSGGCAGGLVGYMATGSSLTVSSELTMSGSVTSEADTFSAGGLVGYADSGAAVSLHSSVTVASTVASKENAGALFGYAKNLVFTFDDSTYFQVDGASLTSRKTDDTVGAGGIAGYYEWDGTDENACSKFDAAQFRIKGLQFKATKVGGGFFGILKNACLSNMLLEFTDTATEPKNIVTSSMRPENDIGYANVGGLFGEYWQSSTNSGIAVTRMEIETTISSSKISCFGGLIGWIDKKDHKSFIDVDNVNIAMNRDTNPNNFGGLIAVNDSPVFLNVGTLTVSAPGYKVNDNGKGAGIITTLKGNSVVRFHGALDLSDCYPESSSTKYAQLILERDAGIVYAVGNGTTKIDDTYDWVFHRAATTLAVSDIGDYGEVVRLDGTELAEVQTEETDVTTLSSALETNNAVLNFATKTHQICLFNIGEKKDSAGIQIGSLRDFVALSMQLQWSGNSFGAFIAGSTDGKYQGSKFLKDTIKINTDIDLRGTGVTSLTRDNGKNSFQGILDGERHTITVATGETYGQRGRRDSSVPVESGSHYRSCGQIYSHNRIGLFGQTSKATIKNLTIDGTYSYGVLKDSYIGAVTAYASGNLTLENVTVNAILDNHEYKADNESSALPSNQKAYCGGLVGGSADSKKLTFTNCTWNSSIIRSSNFSPESCIGGFVGRTGYANTITISGSAVNGSIRSFAYDNTQCVGGLIAKITADYSKSATTLTIDGLTIDGLTIGGESTEGIWNANNPCGGFLGYSWLNTNVTFKDLTIDRSSLVNRNSTNTVVGACVYNASGYWKVGDGTHPGITFGTGNTISIGSKSGTDGSSALLLAIARDTDKTGNTAYIEIMKNGYVINSDTAVTIPSGTYFDDLAGYTEFGDGLSAVVSVGLTDGTAESAVLLDQDSNNSWKNKCKVNDGSVYQNPNTRYYYNVDFYREENAASPVSDLDLSKLIDSPGDLLCWSLYQYAAANIRKYFAKAVGGTIKGTIDLTGVSYYPVKGYANIDGAEITFAYQLMNAKESVENRQFDKVQSQHYQMQTGLFSQIMAADKAAVTFNVKNLTLKGSFGCYQENGKSGVLVCDSITGYNAMYQAEMTLNNVMLNGIQCANKQDLPLLINSIGAYTSTTVDTIYTVVEEGTPTKYTTDKVTSVVASALIGTMGGTTANSVNISFSNIGLDARTDAGSEPVYGTHRSIFGTATLIADYQYADSVSGGSYNFETESIYITYGKEISNTDSGRNKYNDRETSQYCYYDTYGTDRYVYDEKGPGKASRPIAERFVKGYLPYVGEAEGGTNHELDINQKAYFLVDGCGTYGHPYKIQSVQDESAANQLIAVMDVLDGKGSGTVLMVNRSVLQAQSEQSDLHKDPTEKDALYIKSGIAWYPAVWSGNQYKKKSNEDPITNAAMMAYLRNAYFEIEEDIEMNLSKFSGIGGEAVNSAFSGVIVGKKMGNGSYPTITLIGEKPVSNRVVGGLIRYSQGSVVKNLNIVFDRVTVPSGSDSQTPTCFGGVIGWVIGGDNIIDGVSVSAGGVSVSGTYANLMAVGGYVGYVGGNDCLKGGGVVFRNIKSLGLLSVSGSAINEEVSEDNSSYYWNPYVGRVLDGYACAESGTCGSMGTNTDKNYRIPKIDTDKKTITVTSSPGVTLRSAQDLWILSSIVNAGAGCKSSATANNAYYPNNAYYYGRARTGAYDDVGTVAMNGNDWRDEGYTWGGVGSATKSITYLSQFANDEAANDEAAMEALSSLTCDTQDWSLTLEQSTTYDMTGFGNGFRGIGVSYYYDGITSNGSSSAYLPQRARVFHLNALNGNGSTIRYIRHIYEYESEPGECFNSSTTVNAYKVKQAGLFTAYNQMNSDGMVQNLTIQMEITSNQSTIGADAKTGTAFGGCFGRQVTNNNKNNKYKTTFKNLRVTSLGGTESSTVQNAYYAGGIFGTVECGNEEVFENCTISNLKLANVSYGGAVGGFSTKSTTIKTCEVSDVDIQISNTGEAGGLIGQISGAFTVSGTKISNLSIDGSSASADAGGIAGYAGGAPIIGDTTVSAVKIAAKGYCGGVFGRSNKDVRVKNVAVSSSYIATLSKDRGTGALTGYLENGPLSAFNVLSKDNVLGYLVNGTSLDTSATTLKSSEQADVSKLSCNNIGKRTANSVYASYGSITSGTTFYEYDRSGIWVGNANSKSVKIVAASRQGNYSAIKNIGINGNASGNYVIYADYLGSGNAASKINSSPDTGIQFGDIALTGDGASLNNNVALSKTIISDTKEKNWMRGYYGANSQRSLDGIINSFDSNYGSLLTTYKTEEPKAAYVTAENIDLPVLVLEMLTSAELNTILSQYISVLTNVDQTSQAQYSSISATTYVYSGRSWSVSGRQTMGKNSSTGLLKINTGEYDNTRNQITIIDVTFNSPIANSGDCYHLYIPVLVKKVMDVTFTVKTVNGATGYGSGYNTGAATLASFGENYTSVLTYSYKWTAAEWNNAIAFGESLLWSFTKQVNIGSLQASDKENLRLTLVDNNTHGEGKTFYQTTGKSLSSNGTLWFASFEDFSSVPICDLIDLEVSDGTQENPGELKMVASTDPAATLRKWDDSKEAFIYFAPKEVNDPENTDYYHVCLKGQYDESDVVSVSESYYLVMDCTQGSQMYNNVIQLGTDTVTGGNIPARLIHSGNAVYVLGDFYTINDLTIESAAEIPTSSVMKAGTNDFIDIELSSAIQAGADTFKTYVENRFVYFQYAVKLVDQDGAPVDIEASDVTVTLLKIGDEDIPFTEDLSSNALGYAVHQSGSMYYITIKAKGASYIGKSVIAKVHYSYEEKMSLIAQFPTRNRISNAAVLFQADAHMAYQLDGLGGSKMTAHANDQTPYYTEEDAVAAVCYDSYNIKRADGNTSQLGLNGRETNDQPIPISSRAMFNAMNAIGLNTTDPLNEKYPYYLEGTLSLGKKTETDKSEGIGKTYEDVNINTFLSDIVISSMGATVDVISDGLGAQADGTFKFRMQLSKEQVQNILSEQILINIDYQVKTGSELEDLEGAQYANYKVNLSAVLKNSKWTELTNEPSDYLIYTNAKVYLGIIGGKDVD